MIVYRLEDEDGQYRQKLLTHTKTPNSEGMYMNYDNLLTIRQATADFQIFHVFNAKKSLSVQKYYVM